MLEVSFSQRWKLDSFQCCLSTSSLVKKMQISIRFLKSVVFKCTLSAFIPWIIWISISFSGLFLFVLITSFPDTRTIRVIRMAFSIIQPYMVPTSMESIFYLGILNAECKLLPEFVFNAACANDTLIADSFGKHLDATCCGGCLCQCIQHWSIVNSNACCLPVFHYLNLLSHYWIVCSQKLLFPSCILLSKLYLLSALN